MGYGKYTNADKADCAVYFVGSITTPDLVDAAGNLTLIQLFKDHGNETVNTGTELVPHDVNKQGGSDVSTKQADGTIAPGQPGYVLDTNKDAGVAYSSLPVGVNNTTDVLGPSDPGGPTLFWFDAPALPISPGTCDVDDTFKAKDYVMYEPSPSAAPFGNASLPGSILVTLQLASWGYDYKFSDASINSSTPFVLSHYIDKGWFTGTAWPTAPTPFMGSSELPQWLDAGYRHNTLQVK